MAIVEDEVRNDSEEENEIEVVVEEDDGDDQDTATDDSDDDSDDEDVLEAKAEELEKRVTEDPYNYDDHLELIQTLWSLSELERWRAAWARLAAVGAVGAAEWAARLHAEASLAHTASDHARLEQLFHDATLDCYSLPVLTEWCSWALHMQDSEAARAQLEAVLRLAGADPFSGKLFWDARTEYEKGLLQDMNEDDTNYGEQMKRVLFCLEEVVSRPLLHGADAWQDFAELALKMENQEYVDKVKKQHDLAQAFVKQVSHYEDTLLTLDDGDEKYRVYSEYIDTVKELAKDKDKYGECDTEGILKVLYDRATYQCMNVPGSEPLFRAYAALAASRALDRSLRRRPRAAVVWTLKMEHLEEEGRDFDEVKAVLEQALSRGLESYQEAERVWMSYLVYLRRRATAATEAAAAGTGSEAEAEAEVLRLRRTFRLAWDTLAETWGEEANDSEVPVYWARVEYTVLKDPKQGKEIFEEIFKYGSNKSLSKHWELLLRLETARAPAAALHKLRALHRRAVRAVRDYPPAACRLWAALEAERGGLRDARLCRDVCEEKLKEWRQTCEARKEKRIAQKQKGKPGGRRGGSKRKRNESPKRKPAEGDGDGRGVKRKRDSDGEDGGGDAAGEGGSGTPLKRLHAEEEAEAPDTKRKRDDEKEEGSEEAAPDRDACTLFVSNLDFKVDEDKLREKLSEFGDIVSMRVKAGVKAFGGSICYCQYKTPEAVAEAVRHDRAPLGGRPMFLAPHRAAAGRRGFRFAAGAERHKLFASNLPFALCSPSALAPVFAAHGRLREVRVVTHKDGRPKGLAYVEFEDEESAAAALLAVDGAQLGGRAVRVAYSAPPPRAGGSASGAAASASASAAAAPAAGMRRTQLSSFIPSVLQRASTSTAPHNPTKANGNGESSKPLTNSDFRNMLLNNK